ncbi:MAG TPA: tol-pal system protein YbgF [Gemmatimonadaceae bacterium]|nr:tol-pal system protein YbgF [Gemmatimonadaceae bacterium]
MRTALRRLAPVALLVTGACFATREDVRTLQTQMDGMRADAARSDSARRAQLDQVIASLRIVHDSLGLVSSRMVKMQGDIRGDLYEMGQQLIQIQQLTGQSQNRLQELRASLEQRNPGAAQGAAPSGGAAPAGGAQAGGAAAPGTPGPNQLFQLALEQLRRGSAGAARSGFETLLQQYPTADIAPDAEFYLGEAYKAEGNAAGADSVYNVVVAKYPNSPRAPTALYKHALYLEDQGNLTGARAALNQLIQKYPRSDEAALAREHLRTLK